MSHRTRVEFTAGGDYCRAEIVYDRTRHQVRICGECTRSDSEVRVAVRVSQVWCAGSEVPCDDTLFPALVAAAEVAFRQSPAYGEAISDAGPL